MLKRWAIAPFMKLKRTQRRGQSASGEDGSTGKQKEAINFSPGLVSAFSGVFRIFGFPIFPKSPDRIYTHIHNKRYNPETNETAAAERPLKKTEARGSRRKL